MRGFGFAQGFGFGGSGAGSGTPAPAPALRQATNRGHPYSNLGSASTTNNVCAETRRLYTIGGAAQSELRFIFSGYYVDTTGSGSPTNSQELNCGNAVTIECAVEIGAQVKQITFNALPTGVILDGIAEYVSDPLLPSLFGLQSFAANSQFWYRERRTIALNEKFVRLGAFNKLTGENTVFSNGASASQVMATGVLTVPAGGAQQSGPMFCPVAIVGKAVGNPDIAVGGFGDSIMDGFNATGRNGNSDGSDSKAGFFVQGLRGVNGRTIPNINFGASSTKGTNTVLMPDAGTAFQKRAALLKYITHAIENFGTNDIGTAAGSSLPVADIMAAKRILWGKLRAGGVGKIYAVPLIPRTSSTDSWATVANQTPINADFAPGGKRDQINTQLQAAVTAGELDGYFDLNASMADATSPEKWAATGTANGVSADGTHPSDNGGVLGGNGFNSYMASRAPAP